MVRIVTLKLVFLKTVAATSRIMARHNLVVIPEVEAVYLFSEAVDHRQAPLKAQIVLLPTFLKTGYITTELLKRLAS